MRVTIRSPITTAHSRRLSSSAMSARHPRGDLRRKAQVCFVLSEWNVAVQSYGDVVELAAPRATVRSRAWLWAGWVRSHDRPRLRGGGRGGDRSCADRRRARRRFDRTGAMMVPDLPRGTSRSHRDSVEIGKQTAALARKNEQPFYECFCDELFILGYSWRSQYERGTQNAQEGVAREGIQLTGAAHLQFVVPRRRARKQRAGTAKRSSLSVKGSRSVSG